MNKLKKIYFIGNAGGAYRAQNTIKYFLDRPSDYSIKYCDNRYSLSKCKNSGIFCKVIRRLWGYCLNFFDIFHLMISDIVYVLPMSHYHCRFQIYFAKFLRKKIILDFYISIFDTLVLDKKVVVDNRKQEKLRWHERMIVASAEIVIFLNKSECKYYLDLLGIDPRNINKAIIPLCVDYRSPKNNKNYYNKNEVFNICWWGTYIPLHGLEHIINAFSLVEKKFDNVRLYIFGDSDEKAKKYFSIINEIALSHKIIIKNDVSFTNGRLYDFLINQCHLALGTFGESDKAKTVFVNKVIDAISLKIPIITRETNAILEFKDVADSISLLNGSLTPESIAKKIESCLLNYPDYAEKVDSAFLAYNNNFTPQRFYESLDKLLTNPVFEN